MTSIVKRKTKKGVSYSIHCQINGKRRVLSLTQSFDQEDAEEIRFYIDRILSIRETNRPPDRKTLQWIDSLPKEIKRKIAKLDLIEEFETLTVGEIWKRFMDYKEDKVKKSTFENYQTTQKHFFSFFKFSMLPNDITENQAKEWRNSLKEQYSKAYISHLVKNFRAVFHFAVKNNWADQNIFLKIKRGSQVNKTREYFINRADYAKLLDACPDQNWRTLLAFCRIGGLRNPSETLRLKWIDINWEKNRFLVHSPKTEDHEGKETRVVPLFPELRAELDRQWDIAEEGAVFVIDRWRDTEKNMRTQFERIIFRAGLEKWSRLFQNLRSSRDCELSSEFPAHIAAAWMGHSMQVAVKHYLHPTDEDFEKAIQIEKKVGAREQKVGAHIGARLTDNNEK